MLEDSACQYFVAICHLAWAFPACLHRAWRWAIGDSWWPFLSMCTALGLHVWPSWFPLIFRSFAKPFPPKHRIYQPLHPSFSVCLYCYLLPEAAAAVTFDFKDFQQTAPPHPWESSKLGEIKGSSELILQGDSKQAKKVITIHWE